jgi:hypothetical protein
VELRFRSGLKIIIHQGVGGSGWLHRWVAGSSFALTMMVRLHDEWRFDGGLLHSACAHLEEQ